MINKTLSVWLKEKHPDILNEYIEMRKQAKREHMRAYARKKTELARKATEAGIT